MTRRLSSPRTLFGAALALCLCSSLAQAQDPPPTSTPPADRPSALVLPAQLPPALDAKPRASVWRDLFTGTVSDARRFPSKQTLGWLTIGAVAAAGTRPADSHVGRSLSSAAKLDEPLEPGAVIGSTPLQLGLSAATYAVGRAAGWPRMTAVAADLFRAELLAQGLTMGMNESVRRRRPEGSGFAFPSGHTTVSFASATVLQQHLGWRMGAPAYALATYVALSRVQMQRHYLSDVAFGAALGIAAGRTVTLGREKRMHLSPMAADGGAGVQFTWVGKP
jgi:membrane-associated phospholipid phosphatase